MLRREAGSSYNRGVTLAATDRRTCRIEIAIQDGPVAVAMPQWPADCGAEAYFVGRTRQASHPRFGPLVRLEYEMYDPMARKVLDRLAGQAVDRFGCRAIRLVHARGVVGLGEASVVIQVAAPHRAEALDGCRYLIDRLKEELPVWKCEVWKHGRTHVDGCTVNSEGSGDQA